MTYTGLDFKGILLTVVSRIIYRDKCTKVEAGKSVRRQGRADDGLGQGGSGASVRN